MFILRYNYILKNFIVKTIAQLDTIFDDKTILLCYNSRNETAKCRSRQKFQAD